MLYTMPAIDSTKDDTTHLRVRPNVLKHAGDTTQRLVEVMPLLKRILHRLEHALVLLAMRMVRLLRRRHILLQVTDGMFPRLQTLDEEAGDLNRM